MPLWTRSPIRRVTETMSEAHFSDFVVEVRPLTEEDGGGFCASISELPGCAGDGNTREAALQDLQLAFNAWVDTARSMGRDIPRPHSAQKPVAALIRFPRLMHAELTKVAEDEGFSFNQLVITTLATFLGSRTTAKAANSWSAAVVAGFAAIQRGQQVLTTPSSIVATPQGAWATIERRGTATSARNSQDFQSHATH